MLLCAVFCRGRAKTKLLVKKERLDDGKLIQTPDDVLSLQDDVACVKQYEKFLQSKKRKAINIAYHLGYILHKIKESKEFIDMVKKPGHK